MHHTLRRYCGVEVKRLGAGRRVAAAVLGSLWFAGVMWGGPAAAQIIRDPDIGQFCERPSIRQTLVYIDSQVIVRDETDWALQLRDRMTDLAPRERVEIISLSSATGEAERRWRGCWPDYDPAETERIKEEECGLFGCPLDDLEDQQALFRRQMVQALNGILADGRSRSRVQVELEDLPRRSIAEGVALDRSRFDISEGPIRVILYSDMIENGENSDVANAEDVAALAIDMAERYDLELSRANFYVYGVNSTFAQQDGRMALARRLEEFWRVFLRRSGGYLTNYGSDLQLSGKPPRRLAVYRVSLEHPIAGRLLGRMRVLTDADGRLLQSWFGLDNYGAVPISGVATCADSCSVQAKLLTDYYAFQEDDRIDLQGEADRMSGTIGDESEIWSSSQNAELEGEEAVMPLSVQPTDSLQF